MTDFETKKVNRHRLAERVSSDEAARQQYWEIVNLTRRLLENPDAEVPELFADLLVLASDLEPRPPVHVRAGDPTVHPRDRDRTATYTTISIPLADADRGLPEHVIQQRYAFGEALSWLAGGITADELEKISPRAWDVISQWVDERRRDADAYDTDAIALLQLEEPPRRPQGFITHNSTPLTEDEWAAQQEASRRQYTAAFAGDIEYILSDSATIAELSPGLPIAETMHEIRAALATALIAVQAQVAQDKDTPAG